MSKYAIVGLSCLFPGAPTPERYWENLRDGRDCRHEGGAEVFTDQPAEADLDPGTASTAAAAASSPTSASTPPATTSTPTP